MFENSTSSSSKRELVIGVGFHYYLEIVKRFTQGRDYPSLSDTFRLNNVSGGRFTPVGYSHCVASGLGPHRMIEGEFSKLCANIIRYCAQVGQLVRYCVVDFRMFPGPYGRQSYVQLDKNFSMLLYVTANVLASGFVLELPCKEHDWKMTRNLIAERGGYTVTQIKFHESHLVRTNQDTDNIYLRSKNWNTAEDNPNWYRITKNDDVPKSPLNNSKKYLTAPCKRRKIKNHATPIELETKNKDNESNTSCSDHSGLTSVEGRIIIHVYVFSLSYTY